MMYAEYRLKTLLMYGSFIGFTANMDARYSLDSIYVSK